MKYLFTLFAVVAFATANGQINRGGEPLRWGNSSPIELEEEFVYHAPVLDYELIEAQDAIGDLEKDIPYRFGIEVDVDIDLMTEAKSFESTDNGTRYFFYKLDCPEATSISTVFDEFYLPKGAELFIWNENRTKFIGAFNHLNNKDWGSLGVGLIYGSEVIIEVHADANVNLAEIKLRLGTVVHGYRNILRDELQPEIERGPFGNSGNCNINVNCPEGEDWQAESKSVALIVSGGYSVCTGALLNNTAQDGTPYFLTANHCLGGHNNWVFYFNHEAANCTQTTGPTNQSVSGSSLRASNGGSDFALLELSETPPESFDVQYAGWDRTDDETVTSAVGIHHPRGDVKKICFEDDEPYHDALGGTQVWWIDDWEDGVTEGGSSGSPLFDQNHRIIGQLFGGAAACQGPNNNNGQFDYYGRLGVSWNGNSSNRRLRDWLDPISTGAIALDGWPIGAELFQVDASASSIQGIEAVVCGSTVTPTFNLVNNGVTTLTSVTINYAINNGNTELFVWEGNLNQGQSTQVSIPTIIVQNGTNNLYIEVVSPNGLTDEDNTNNSTNFSFNAVLEPTADIDIELILDDYGSETTWELSQDEVVIIEGGPYADDLDQTLVLETICLADGCYVFKIMDSYGDGICCGYGNGSYNIVNNGISVLTGGEFTDEDEDFFCVGDVNVTESDLANFNMFPNPALKDVHFTWNDQSNFQLVQVVNPLGQVLLEQNVNGMSNTTLKIDGLSSGWYAVRLISLDRLSSKTLFVR